MPFEWLSRPRELLPQLGPWYSRYPQCRQAHHDRRHTKHCNIARACKQRGCLRGTFILDRLSDDQFDGCGDHQGCGREQSAGSGRMARAKTGTKAGLSAFAAADFEEIFGEHVRVLKESQVPQGLEMRGLALNLEANCKEL